jgi:PAS domain S-box-containing protein
MSEKKNPILQIEIDSNFTLQKIIYINANAFVKSIYVGMSLFDLMNEKSKENFLSVYKKDMLSNPFTVQLNDYYIDENKCFLHCKKIQNGNTFIIIERVTSNVILSKMNALENLLLDLSTDGIIVVNRFGNIHYTNQAFSEISKYDSSMLKGKLFYPLFIHFEKWTNENSNDKKVNYDEIISLDGARIPVQIIKHSVRISEQERGVVYIVKNVSQLKNVENELGIREQIIDSIFYASEKFLFSTDWEKNINAVLRHLGKSMDVSRINLIKNHLNRNEEICMQYHTEWTNMNIEPHKKSVNERCVPYFPAYEDLFFELSKGNVYFIDYSNENEQQRFYHELLQMKSTILVPIFSQDKWWGFLGVDECKKERVWKKSELQSLKQIANIMGAAVYQNTMISNVFELKDKAEESDRLKTSFLSNIGHELRTPINAIMGFGELLKKTSLSPEKTKEYLNHVTENSKKLLKSIDHLIDFAKLEAGTIVLKPENIELSSFADEIAYFTSLEIQKFNKKIQVQVHKTMKDITITTDKKRLFQIFEQLISNAIKFTHAGNIEIGYTMLNNQVEFYVSDTGIGIAKEYHELIFNSFRQLEKETTRTNAGMGIGLSITKRIVEYLNGTIWVSSEMNQGTTVFFSLPKEYVSESNEVEKHETEEVNQIFIIEENDEIYFKLHSILRQRYDHVKRVKSLNEVEPEKAQLVIINALNISQNTLAQIENFKKRFPTLKLVNHLLPESKTKISADVLSLLPEYGKLLSGIKNIIH